MARWPDIKKCLEWAGRSIGAVLESDMGFGYAKRAGDKLMVEFDPDKPLPFWYGNPEYEALDGRCILGDADIKPFTFKTIIAKRVYAKAEAETNLLLELENTIRKLLPDYFLGDKILVWRTRPEVVDDDGGYAGYARLAIISA